MSKISIKTDFVDGEKLFSQELNNNFLVIQAGINANEENLQQVIDQAIIELDAELEAITADRGWDWNGGDRVTFFKGTTSQVNTQEIKNGQMLYNTETGETALDDNNTRIVTGSGNVIAVSSTAPTNPATKEWIKPATIDGVATAEEYFRDTNNNWVKISTEPGGDTLPIGAITQFSGNTAPTNWLFCNGQAVSRITYSELFGVIGTTYGEGDGSTTFNLPDFIGRVPVGIDTEDSDFDVLGEIGGEKKHTLTVEEMPSHSHEQYVTANVGYTATRLDFNSEGNSERYPQCQTGEAGGDQPHNILQPYAVTNFIIKAKQSVGIVGTVTTDINNQNVDSVPNTPTVKNYVNAKSTYSTGEQVVGTWVDGKPLYRKIFTGTGNNTDIGNISDVDQLVSIKGTIKATYGQIWPIPNFFSEQQYWNSVFYDPSNTNVSLGTGNNYDSSSKYVVILEYTKTTD